MECRFRSILIKTPYKVFPSKVWEHIHSLFPSLQGVKVCVPSSGDNLAAFGFALLGAEVTSCDLSDRQIENAGKMAKQLGLTLNFVVSDSMDLSVLASEQFDLVYTSIGAHVWISDLSVMYCGFYRILKKGGYYLFFDTHPFNRPFDDSNPFDTDRMMRVVKRYDAIGPFEEVPEYYWRVQDMVNALSVSGFGIVKMEELYAEKDILSAKWWYEEAYDWKEQFDWDRLADWKQNPYAAIPQWISFCAMK